MASSKDMTRRQAAQVTGGAAVALAAAPYFSSVKAANNVVNYAVIGTGGRGQYHIQHFNGIDGGRCVAVCDIDQANLDKAKQLSRDKPEGYKDYHAVLARNDVDAVLIATPLFAHFPVTRDALLAGKHVFCEKSLVFRPEEVHELRKLSTERPRQVLQVGLQRRYSKFYQTAKQMIEKGTVGRVTHVYAQWHRSGLSRTWTPPSWRCFRKFSGGLTAELASHQIDIADWMIGSHPEFVTGVGGIDEYKDGRDIYDNIQLIFKYPGGQKLMYSSISTNKHLALFGSTRTEFGEMIMGTEGTIHITVGTDNEPATALWFYEPSRKPAAAAKGPEKAAPANASLVATGKGGKGLPVLLERDMVQESDSFLRKELKFAKLWLYKKGIMVPEEDRNPVDIQLEEWFACIRNPSLKPKADLDVGLADSANVILSNLAMDSGRRVMFSEMDTMGLPAGARAVKKA
jgi:predicted dehydrogenase